MNERIKQLYEQSMEQHASNNTAWEELNPEKFAELIVKECANVAWDIAHQYNSDEINDVGYSILDHFGIEQ